MPTMNDAPGARGALRTLPAVLAIFLAVSPAPSSAQEAGPDLGPDRLRVFATAHLQVTEARDEYHQRIGRTHEEQSRLHARQELEARIAAILEEAEITHEEYDRFILIISIDAEARAAFDAVLAKLLEERGGVDGPAEAP